MSNSTYILCKRISETELVCNGTEFIYAEPSLTVNDGMFWAYLGGYVGLVLGAGLMSGLTLGLLSLDTVGLEVLKQAGSPAEKKYAKRIYPLIERHHILLVTLLLGNAACVETMPIFLDRISNPIMAIIISVTAVLVFGEIIPQALCKRYGLAIGYYTLPIVYVLMAISFVISWPISKLLDCMFGHETGQLYRRPQLKALVGLHGPPQMSVSSYDDSVSGSQSEGQEIGDLLTRDEVMIIKGAIDMTHKSARDAMVPLNQVFMMSDSDTLDKDIITKILCFAHSRIPVYRGGDKKMIYGILLSKMLISINHEDKVQVSSLLNNKRYFRPVPYVTETFPLYDLLNMFQTGKSHMAIVVKDEISEEDLTKLDSVYETFQTSTELISVPPPVIGIITLEDIMEQLIQEPIRDEGDLIRDRFTQMVSRRRRQGMLRSTSRRSSQSNMLRSGRLYDMLAHAHTTSDLSDMDDTPVASGYNSERTPLVSRQRPGYDSLHA